MVLLLAILLAIILIVVFNATAPKQEIPYFEREKHERLNAQTPYWI